jgi:hypothetical protein
VAAFRRKEDSLDSYGMTASAAVEARDELYRSSEPGAIHLGLCWGMDQIEA